MRHTDDEIKQLTDLSLESKAFYGHYSRAENEDVIQSEIRGVLAMGLRCETMI